MIVNITCKNVLVEQLLLSELMAKGFNVDLLEAATDEDSSLASKLIALKTKSKTLKSGNQPIDAEEWKFSELCSDDLNISSQVSNLISSDKILKAIKKLSASDKLALTKKLDGKDAKFEKACKERDD